MINLKTWYSKNKKTQLLTKGSKKRSGIKLESVEKIVLHYTAVANASPNSLWRYWKGTERESYAAAHFGVGNKSFVMYIPTDEVAYHVGAKSYMQLGRDIMKISGKRSPNFNTIGIEMCQEGMPRKSIEIPKETLNNTIYLTVYLLIKFNLTPKDVCGHFQVTGKHCPAFALVGGKYGGQCTDETQLQQSAKWMSLISDISKLYENIL